MSARAYVHVMNLGGTSSLQARHEDQIPKSDVHFGPSQDLWQNARRKPAFTSTDVCPALTSTGVWSQRTVANCKEEHVTDFQWILPTYGRCRSLLPG